MSKNSSAVLTSVIIAIGVILGVAWFAYNKKADNNEKLPTNNTQNVSPSPTTPPAPQSFKQKLIASMPGQGASKQELDEFAKNVAGAAEESTTLDISGCKPTPEILHVKIGRSFKVTNGDSADHTISHPKNITIDVAGRGEKEVTLNTEGIFGYACDASANKTQTIGIFFVTP